MGMVQARTGADPVRTGPRLRLSIDSMAAGTYVIGNDKPMRVGMNEAVIQKEDLPLIQAMVEDRWDLWDRAEEAHERHFQAFMIERFGAAPGPNASTAQLAKWSDQLRKGRQTYTGSREVEFVRLTETEIGKSRTRRPFRSVTVVEELPPALGTDARMVRDVLAEVVPLFAQGALPAQPGGHADTIAQLQAQIVTMRGQLEALARAAGTPAQEVHAADASPRGWPKGRKRGPKPRKHEPDEGPKAS